MRPRRLVLANYGPYRGTVEVDFDRLGDVFLVCGKTGSGKSSLFDALTYALYGRAPESRGSLERELRSHLASPEEETRVELEFWLGQDALRVVRTPPYSRPARRALKGGQGLVEVPATAALYEGHGTDSALVSDRISEVDETLRGRIGLTQEEFTKIVLLPQGAFQRFLEMNSSDRTAVLQKLFPVDLHDRTANLARERAQEARRRLEYLDGELARLDAELGKAGEGGRLEDLEEALERARARERALGAELEARRAELREARETVALLERRERDARALSALEAGRPAREAWGRALERDSAARAAAPRVEAREKADGDLESAREELRSAGMELEDLESRSAAVSESARNAEELAARAARLDAEAGALEAARSAWERARAAGLALRSARGEEEAARAEAEARARDLGDAERRRQELAPGPEEEAAARERRELARTALEEARYLRERAKRAQDLARKRDAARNEAEERNREAEEASRDASVAEARLVELSREKELCRAGELAAALVPGEPCPVCGSREHPAPARPRLDSFSLEDRIREAGGYRDAARAREASARSLARQRLREAEAAEAELDALGPVPDPEEASALVSAAEAEDRASAEAQLALAERARAAAAARAEADTLAELLRAARERLSEAARVVAASEAAESEARASAGERDPTERLERIRAERTEVERARSAALEEVRRHGELLSSARTRRTLWAERIPDLEAAREAARAAEESALASAGFRDGPECRAALLSGPDRARIASEAERFDRDLAEAAARARASAEAAEGRSPPDLAVLSEAEQVAAARLEDARAAVLEASGRADAARRGESRRRELFEERKGLEEKSRTLDGLSRLLSGELSGSRLPFKNYALSMYLRQVARAASRRLLDMSDRRYSLSVDEGPARGTAKAGLELSVHDSFTGRSRPAGTLSGGEKFLASIALALGLADVITRRAGGIALDAVFIDEGFGSLDDEALDRAIEVLDRVREGRMVGLISHVPELRDRIPARIEVTKGRGGSRLRIEAVE